MGISVYSVICCTVVGILLRWSVATFPYSGQNKPPKFGDYEAHRHWMEVTHNLPLREWYVSTTRNNLKYWGLDYPPLSAYHSYAVGIMFNWIIPESMTLHSSRGYESPLHKFLMRLSVSMSDLLLPALVIFHLKFGGSNSVSHWAPVLLAVTAPPFILVDYGHFQYNCVSLGLTVAAVIALLSNQMSLTAILFTLAVNHKQMSLYHAIPFFMYMIATVIVRRGDVFTCFRIGTTILSTLGLLWLPFGDRVVNVFQRIFPVKRGIFEDKVGTFWYALDRFVPIKDIPDAQLARTSAIVCMLLVAPCAVHLLLVISRKKSAEKFGNQVFILSLLNVSLIFFLFSYHVHEKTIMLPVLAAVMLLQWYPRSMLWFIAVSSLSLYPLFYEEKSYVALLLITSFFLLVAQQLNIWASVTSNIMKTAFIISIGGYAVIIAGHHLITPPTKLPHLFPVLIALYSFVHFAAFSIYFHSVQLPMNTTASSASAQPHRHKIKKR